MEWLELLTTTSTGGLIGILGSWLTKREERKNLELVHSHEEKMAAVRKQEAQMENDHELAMADKEMERAEVEGQIAIEAAEIEAFRTSLKSQSVSSGIKFVDGVRGLMRPLITIYLLVIATFLVANIHTIVGGLEALESLKGNKNSLLETYDAVIDQLLFLTATAVTWWFGSRPSSSRKVS